MFPAFIPMHAHASIVEYGNPLTRVSTSIVCSSYSLAHCYADTLFYTFKMILSVPRQHVVSCPAVLSSGGDMWNSKHTLKEGL